jgi:hypothetical protein
MYARNWRLAIMATKDADETIKIAKKILRLIGGDPGLMKLQARAISTIPGGIEFLVPWGTRVQIVQAAHCYDVTIIYPGWKHKAQTERDVAEDDLVKVIERRLSGRLPQEG